MPIASQVVKKKKAGRPSTQKYNLETTEGLAGYARSVGMNRQADEATKTPKLSVWQRLGRGLSAFETGNALYKKRYENASFGKTYVRDIGIGLKEAVTGRQATTETKRTFKDVMVKEGMKDRPGKIDVVDVTGLAADILADPSTYLGSAVGKGLLKGGKLAVKASTKLPVIGKSIANVGEGLSKAFTPMYEVLKAKGGQKYADEYLKFAKGTRAAADDYMSEVTARASGIKKALGKKGLEDAGKTIGETVETAAKTTGNPLLDDAMNYLTEFAGESGKQLKDRGLINNTLDDWMHHMLTPEASQVIGDARRSGASILPKKFFSREIGGTVENINAEWMKKYGHNLFEADAFKAFAKSGVDSIKAIRSYDFAKRVASQFGEVAENGQVIDGVKFVKPEGKLAKIVGDVALPEPIVKHMTQINGMFGGEETTNQFFKLYDKALNIWKSTVTGYFPSFHTRNATGGIFNNFLAGLNNPVYYKTANDLLAGKDVTVKAGKTVLDKTQLLTLLKEHGILGQTGILDVPEALQKSVNPSLAQRASSIPQKVMGAIEDRMRTPLFLHQLEKGLKKGLSVDEAAEKAGKTVIKYHFDYMPEGFTAFEKNVMKRIIPFYTWTRHNIPLQLEQMLMQPAKYAGVFKTQRAWGTKPSSEEEQVLPRWLKERYTIKGEGGYWSGIGLPLEEATEKLSAPLRGFGVSLSPFIKVPIERLTGWNIFKEKKIDEDIYGNVYKNAPEPIKEFLELKELENKDGKKYYTLNPERRYWLEVIGARGLNTAVRLTNYVDDPKNLLTLITTIRKYDYDLEEMKRWSDAERRSELEKALQQAGELKTFERTYVPKE